MLNIMDLASKYLPDLDKITAGIAKNYSKDDTSTESSYTPQKKVYKSKRPRKKKKKKIVLIKRKLQIPEPPVVPKRVVTTVTRAKQKTAKRKTSNFLKALSSSANFKETKKETKKRPEKLLKGADVKSGQEGNKAGSIKEKSKKSGAKKKDMIVKPSVQMDKALEEFNRRKSQFMASLRLLQQHLSNLKSEQLKLSVPKSKIGSPTKKQKAVKRKKKTSKKTKDGSTSSKLDSVTSTSTGSSDSGTGSSEYETAFASEPASRAVTSDKFPAKTSKPVQLTKQSNPDGERIKNDEISCPEQIHLPTLKHLCIVQDAANASLSKTSDKNINNFLSTVTTGTEIKVPHETKTTNEIEQAPFEYCKIFEPKPISKELIEQRRKKLDFSPGQKLLFTSRRPCGKPPVRTVQEIIREAQRPFILESDSNITIEEETKTTKCQCMANCLGQSVAACIDTEQLVAEKSKRTHSEIKSPKKDESIKKTKTEEFPVQKEETTSVVKETDECISKESSESPEKLVQKSQIESEPVPDQIQTSVRKSGYEEFIRTVKLLKKQGLLNNMMKQENHQKNIFPGNFSDSNPSCSSERCPNADYRINKLKSNLTLNNDGPTEQIQLNSHYAQPISFVEYMDKSFEQQTNKDYKNLAQQRALKLKPLFNKSIPVKRQIFDNEYKIEEENAQTGSGDKNKNESIVKSMKSLLPKCTVYRGRH